MCVCVYVYLFIYIKSSCICFKIFLGTKAKICICAYGVVKPTRREYNHQKSGEKSRKGVKEGNGMQLHRTLKNILVLYSFYICHSDNVYYSSNQITLKIQISLPLYLSKRKADINLMPNVCNFLRSYKLCPLPNCILKSWIVLLFPFCNEETKALRNYMIYSLSESQ